MPAGAIGLHAHKQRIIHNATQTQEPGILDQLGADILSATHEYFRGPEVVVFACFQLVAAVALLA